MEHHIRSIFGSCEPLYVTNTLHVDDYARYRMKHFDVGEKTRRHNEVFPLDCMKAFEMGTRFAEKSR
jgi:hypothetical protein